MADHTAGTLTAVLILTTAPLEDVVESRVSDSHGSGLARVAARDSSLGSAHRARSFNLSRSAKRAPYRNEIGDSSSSTSLESASAIPSAIIAATIPSIRSALRALSGFLFSAS